MNRILALAGLASAAIGAVHVFAGGAAVHDVMRAAEFDAFAMATMTACWHAVTLLFGLFAVGGLWGGVLSRAAANVIAVFGAALFAGFAAIFLWLTLVLFGDPLGLEQWLLLLPLAGLFGAAYRRR